MHFIPLAKIRIFSDIFTIFASCTIKSTKAIKRVIKIVWRSLIATVSILFAAALIIQLPQVQTFITGKLMDRISEDLDGDIVFEKIHFKPFTTLVLKNAAIIDRNPATDSRKAVQWHHDRDRVSIPGGSPGEIFGWHCSRIPLCRGHVRSDFPVPIVPVHDSWSDS